MGARKNSSPAGLPDPDAAARLKAARARRYPTAAAAAHAMGFVATSYAQYENGTRGFRTHADRFARFFGVRIEWLITGGGDIAGQSSLSLPIKGYVGAGSLIDEWAEPKASHWALPGDVSAYEVIGDSMRPRFLPGEIILIESKQVADIGVLVGQYAVVRTNDARMMIKILRRGRREGTWNLESINADPEENVVITSAWRYLGALAGAHGALAEHPEKPRSKKTHSPR